MASTNYDIVAEQGSDLSFVITYKNAAGNLVNLAGYTAKMQVRKRAGDPAAYLSLTETNGITLGGGAGTVTIGVNSASLSAIPAGNYIYDLRLDSNSGLEERLIEGDFYVHGAVTR